MPHVRTCSYCGKEYSDEATACAIDGRPLIDPSKPAVEAPLEEKPREWIEKSFLWLLAEFGEATFLKHQIVLPEASCFPDKYDRSEESVLKVVKRVCSYMDVDPDLVDVEFFVDRDDTAARHHLAHEE